MQAGWVRVRTAICHSIAYYGSMDAIEAAVAAAKRVNQARGFQFEMNGNPMHDSCMATKTISLELDAYEHLKAAKGPGESFSDVVRRATFRKRPLTAQDLLSRIEKRGPMFSERDLQDLEKTHDVLSTIPDDPWRI